jgi:hypothetical protein
MPAMVAGIQTLLRSLPKVYSKQRVLALTQTCYLESLHFLEAMFRTVQFHGNSILKTLFATLIGCGWFGVQYELLQDGRRVYRGEETSDYSDWREWFDISVMCK